MPSSKTAKVTATLKVPVRPTASEARTRNAHSVLDSLSKRPELGGSEVEQERSLLLYMQIQRALIDRIRRKDYPVGSRIPTESELRREFHVSRHTVREALRHLRDEGYISSRQGSGYTVESVPEQQGFVHSVNSVDELFQYVAKAKLELLGMEMVKADATLAARLNCSPGRRWLRMWGVRVGQYSALPIGYMEVFVHEAYAGIHRQMEDNDGPIYALIEREYGERVDEVVQTLRGATIPPELSDVLKVPPGSASLEIERVFKTRLRKVVEVSFNYHPVDRFSYTMVLRSVTRENAGTERD